MPALNPHSLKIAANKVVEPSHTNFDRLSNSSGCKTGSNAYKNTKNADTSFFDNRSNILKIGKEDKDYPINPKLNISHE